MENTTPNLDVLDPEIVRLMLNKQSGYNYRERREEDWRENYTLYRDRVITNRLTQRQSVNVPLMKTTIKTILKDTDDMPVIYFENLDNDKQRELFLNEYWKYTLDYNKAELFDLVDKKQEGLFGRTFDQWQIMDGKVKITSVATDDILVDRYCDPTNIHSSRFLIHTHIFVPLSVIEANEDYDEAKVADLVMWHGTQAGLIKNADNQKMLVEKNNKMRDLGLTDVEEPILGETIVELTLHFLYDKKEGDDEEQIYLKVEADNYNILLNKPLEKIIGETKDHFWRNHYPYNSWADDLEKQDFWSDGIGDVVRTGNKVANTWYSQLVENRTLRNFNMHYHAQVEGWTPQTYQPMPWGWYEVPVPAGGKVQDVLQTVEIPELSESLDEMEYVITMIEKATGATAAQQGQVEQRQVTLGEVQLAIGEAKERIKGISKLYTQVWKERAEMFLKLIEAAPDKLDMVRIYKKGLNSDDIYTREIGPEDWRAEMGYNVRIWSQDEKNNKDTQDIEKTNAAKANMPDNPKVDEVFKRRLLEFAGFTPQEVTDAMQFEQQKREAQLAMMQGGMPGQPGLPGPGVPGGQPALPPGPVNTVQ